MENKKKPFIFKNLIENLKKGGKENGKTRLLILLLCGLLLLVIALPTNRTTSRQSNNSEKEQETATQEETNQTEAAYIKELEEKLEQILAKVENVGKVQVMITLKSSREQVVEKDRETGQSSVEETDNTGGSRNTSESTTKETTIYQESTEGKNSPYVIKELQPELEGVIVIAQGGDDPVVVKDISEAVMALFPIEIHKIKVMRMQS